MYSYICIWLTGIVVIDGYTSNYVYLISGVPRGTALGCVMFLLQNSSSSLQLLLCIELSSHHQLQHKPSGPKHD